MSDGAVVVAIPQSQSQLHPPSFVNTFLPSPPSAAGPLSGAPQPLPQLQPSPPQSTLHPISPAVAGVAPYTALGPSFDPAIVGTGGAVAFGRAGGTLGPVSVSLNTEQQQQQQQQAPVTLSAPASIDPATGEPIKEKKKKRSKDGSSSSRRRRESPLPPVDPPAAPGPGAGTGPAGQGAHISAFAQAHDPAQPQHSLAQQFQPELVQATHPVGSHAGDQQTVVPPQQSTFQQSVVTAPQQFDPVLPQSQLSHPPVSAPQDDPASAPGARHVSFSAQTDQQPSLHSAFVAAQPSSQSPAHLSSSTPPSHLPAWDAHPTTMAHPSASHFSSSSSHPVHSSSAHPSSSSALNHSTAHQPLQPMTVQLHPQPHPSQHASHTPSRHFVPPDSQMMSQAQPTHSPSPPPQYQQLVHLPTHQQHPQQHPAQPTLVQQPHYSAPVLPPPVHQPLSSTASSSASAMNPSVYQSSSSPISSSLDHQKWDRYGGSSSSSYRPHNHDNERCEGCFGNAPITYCVDCDRLLCQACDASAHTLKADQTHRRGLVSDAFVHRIVCPSHPNQKLKYFCESCDQPVCSDCRVVGQHQGQSHMCMTLEEAYRIKLQSLQNALDSKLGRKKQDLLGQLKTVQAMMDDVRYARGTIERETRLDSDSIVDRLAAAEGVKVALLQHDMDRLRQDLNAIQDFTRDAATAKSSSRDIFHFLRRYRDLTDFADRLANKPLHNAMHITPNDLPQETKVRHDMLQKYQSMESVLKVKDKMIWFLLQERERLKGVNESSEKHVQALDTATKKEMDEWIRLTDKFAGELQQFKLYCRYCGVPLSGESVNTACKEQAAYVDVANLPPSTLPGAHFFEKFDD